MLLLVILIVALFAAVMYATSLFRTRFGWMSNQWVAEHRASRAP
jgi:hypothetical protein